MKVEERTVNGALSSASVTASNDKTMSRQNGALVDSSNSEKVGSGRRYDRSVREKKKVIRSS